MSDIPKFIVACHVHEGGVWEPHAARLEDGIKQAYKAIIHSEAKVHCIWMRMPAGRSFLAGFPSTASTLLAPVPDNIDQKSRENFMTAICTDWQAITDCSVNEIIVNAMNVSAASDYIAMSRARIAPDKSKWVTTKLLVNALYNRVSKGYLAIDTNMP